MLQIYFNDYIMISVGFTLIVFEPITLVFYFIEKDLIIANARELRIYYSLAEVKIKLNSINYD